MSASGPSGPLVTINIGCHFPFIFYLKIECLRMEGSDSATPMTFAVICLTASCKGKVLIHPSNYSDTKYLLLICALSLSKTLYPLLSTDSNQETSQHD